MGTRVHSNELLILGAGDVTAALDGRRHDVVKAVRAAYEAHTRGQSSLPHSSFLRFPDSDRDRIIALPAYLGADFAVAGLKWIASVPANVERGIERASAVIVLNDRETGRPKAILEGSLISKQRTAASAALAARVLRAGRPPTRVGLVGCGPINLEVTRFLSTEWPQVKRFVVCDLDIERAGTMRRQLLELRGDADVTVTTESTEVLSGCELVSFATTAIEPYVDDLSICRPGATLLHVSLRDLTASAVLASEVVNVVDDLDHVCRAETSIELAAEKSGNHAFVLGSLGEVLLDRVRLPQLDDRVAVFSPFGLGILDLAVAALVYDTAIATDGYEAIEGFLP